MKRILSFLLLLALTVTLCACSSAPAPSEIISSLDGAYAIDIAQYAKDEKLDPEDLKGCSSVWTFAPDGTLSITLTTSSSVNGVPEALRKPTTTTAETTYSISENITCALPATLVYTISGEDMLWENGIVMGSIKSNKTSKGVTTIKLDTPNGGSKTLKGTLDESSTLFTVDVAENKISGTYAIKSDNTLTAEKGVLLGTITDRKIEGTSITLTVTAPDGSAVTYTGSYEPDFKVGSVKYTFTYANNTLTLISSKRKLTLVRQ